MFNPQGADPRKPRAWTYQQAADRKEKAEWAVSSRSLASSIVAGESHHFANLEGFFVERAPRALCSRALNEDCRRYAETFHLGALVLDPLLTDQAVLIEIWSLGRSTVFGTGYCFRCWQIGVRCAGAAGCRTQCWDGAGTFSTMALAFRPRGPAHYGRRVDIGESPARSTRLAASVASSHFQPRSSPGKHLGSQIGNSSGV